MEMHDAQWLHSAAVADQGPNDETASHERQSVLTDGMQFFKN